MKPPPRKRSKPLSLCPVPEPQRPAAKVKQNSNWDLAEQRRLLNGLKRLNRTGDGKQDIDYASLKKSVPTRSIQEIQAVVESLKNKAISRASSKLKRDGYAEKKIRKPIALWTCLASALAGTHEESISNAFSQMLIVSSTEPCTLSNCDPPKTYTPVGRTTPFRPVQGQHPGTNTTQPLRVVKTPADRAPKSKIPGASPAASSISTSLSAVPSASPVTGASEQPPTTISTTSSHTALSSPATGLPPAATTAPSSAASSRSAASSGSTTPAAAVRLGHTSKSAIQGSPVESVESVDFEKLYRYLGRIHESDNECELTPMESAILLDLLMSLQEEIPHLDCNKLRKHLIQVHRRLSSPADSKAAGELFRDLKDGGPGSTSQQNTAGTADDSDQSQSKDNKTLSQSEDKDVMGLCPPLNPFMIPLNLLMRR